MSDLRTGPQRSQRKLRPSGDSSKVTTIDKEAWQDANIPQTESVDLSHWYFPDEQVVVIDFSGVED